MKITPREKGETRRGTRKMQPRFSLSPPRLAFLAWGDFRVRSTIPEEKWGVLVVYIPIPRPSLLINL